MATKKITSYKGKAMRITRLDACGTPAYGPAAVVVTGGFITVTITENMLTGDEFTQKNAWGDLCLNEADPDVMKWADVKAQFCEIDPDVMDIFGGATPFVVGTDTVGWTRGTAINTDAFALELWTKVGGVNACSGGGLTWGYLPIPFLKNGSIDGDLTIANAPLNLGLKAQAYGAPAAWGIGPHGDKVLGGTFPTGEVYGFFNVPIGPPSPTTGVATLFGPRSAVEVSDVYPAEATVTAEDATNAAKLTALGFVPKVATAWTTGQYFSVGTFKFNWTGAAWAAGAHA